VTKRVAILISGRGSNMAALVRATREPDYPAEVVVVISDQPGAAGLARAQAAKIKAVVVERSAYGSRASFEEALDTELNAARTELVCLAGFMRVLSPAFVDRWHDRMINVHPSLLPAFKGIDTHQRAIEAGVRMHGCTIHFVRHTVDDGPIIAQGAVPVVPGDTVETLSARLLAVEHQVYPMALKLVASGRARVIDDRVVIDGEEPGEIAPLIVPALS
jgi:phosphoribosylglycinamide formyltransferase-1